jgi:hypothetical protein
MNDLAPFTRRQVIIALTALAGAGLAAPAAHGQKIGIIREFADLVGAIGDSLGKLADGFEKLVGTGLRTYDAVAARRAESRLYSLRVRLTRLAGVQTILVFDTIPDYLETQDPAIWQRVTKKLASVSKIVSELLKEVSAERSDFVATETYDTITRTLYARRNLIEKLQAMTPPTTEAELNGLRLVQQRYGKMVENLLRANTALGAYLRSLPKEATTPQP